MVFDTLIIILICFGSLIDDFLQVFYLLRQKTQAMTRLFTLLCLIYFNASIAVSQNCQQTVRFTWQGDSIGNKAIWKTNDVMNTYNVQGVDVKVSIIDPHQVNTTTLNPSEFNDYTKSNAYFGPGSLMLQATSTTSNQPLCMEFAFSVPVVIEDFRVYDIDYIGRGRPESSFQDSVSFFASMNNVNVPLKLDYLTLFPSFNIIGQSARSKYIVNTNGDIQHTDLKGAVKVSSQNTAFNKFTICYANGSSDDGVSNSHAVKLVGFDFCTTGIGSVSGKVKTHQSGTGIIGSTIQMFDTTGQALLSAQGLPRIAITGLDGSYQFHNIPWGTYDILQVGQPIGFFSVDDEDGGNDDRIRVTIDVNNPIAINKDFIESAVPLPVSFGGMELNWMGDDRVEISWQTLQEVNNDFFTIHFSEDGKNFTPLYKVISQGNSQSLSTYSAYHTPGRGNHFYYKISQTDFDGRQSELGIALIKRTQRDLAFSVFPNPSSDFVSVDRSQFDDVAVYSIFDSGGKVIKTGWLTPERIPVHDLKNGLYYLQITCDQQQAVLPFQKQ